MKYLAFIIGMFALVCVPLASAITVTITPSEGSTGAGTYLSGSDIALTTAFSGTGHTEVVIQIAGGTQSMGHLTIVASSTIPVRVLILGSASGGRMGSISSISTAGSTALVTLDDVRSFGPIGTVFCGNINRIATLGTIDAVTVEPAQTGHPSNIGTLSALNGIRGDLIAESGSIDDVNVTGTGATVGTSTVPIAIRAGTRIGRILAGAVYATISGPAADPLAPEFNSLTTADGPFVGSIQASRLVTLTLGSGGTGVTIAPGIDIYGGDLDADITITDDMVFNPGSIFRPDINVYTANRSIPAGRFVRIGGGLVGSTGAEIPVAFNLPANGLKGQIIINASNGSGVWTAPVKVDGITIDDGRSQPEMAPHYSTTSASLGGGSIGLVPFALHDEDCTPANAPSSPPAILNSKFCGRIPGEEEYITLRFYGPVRVDHTSASPVTIRADGTPSVLSERATGAFLTRSSTGAASREVEIRGSNLRRLMPGVYRIRPVTAASDDGVYALRPLLCDGTLVEPNPPLVANFEYVFTLISDCNDNGIDDATEIAQNRWLDLFPEDGFIDYCYSGTCGLDYNGDGNVDQDDVQCLAQAIGGNSSCLADGADPDFNQDGNIDQDDVLALGSTIAGDPCPW